MRFREVKRRLDDTYTMKRNGLWGYEWHRWSLVEKWCLIFANYLHFPWYVWRLIQRIFPQVNSIKAIKPKK